MSRWPDIDDRDEFDRITHDMRREDYENKLAAMNVTQRTWHVGPWRIDLRPRWTWGRIAPRMFSLGRISVGWR